MTLQEKCGCLVQRATPGSDRRQECTPEGMYRLAVQDLQVRYMVQYKAQYVPAAAASLAGSTISRRYSGTSASDISCMRSTDPHS